jgi:DNA-binding MarR family transcriptional regulator
MSDLDAIEPIGIQQDQLYADAASMLNDAGRALFRLGRIFGRHPMREQIMERRENTPELSQILVTEAVAAATAETEQEVTVGIVAERLAIDPSTASRLVAETIVGGYLSRAPSQIDSRRIRLRLTDAGYKLVEDAHRYQRIIFEAITKNWPEQERRDFAHLLVKFAASVAEKRIS